MDNEDRNLMLTRTRQLLSLDNEFTGGFHSSHDHWDNLRRDMVRVWTHAKGVLSPLVVVTSRLV
ncbi:hypothetical protein N7471_002399 [Penicillium samsonianum]|uniref:uncharacterized protein n=1 Tax=Penicillium samsonianum TaxID=1882272 RepID=UPI002547423D|nr:uncharacterized protein N7471_002399 [Penicillium samsonianum]KAJ6142946.1 hypothetical protein N7471_002399 [Penicillium samsonianum]